MTRIHSRLLALSGLPIYVAAAQLAPLPDAGVANAVDGLVGPFHGRGGEGLGVDVAGCGVEGEGDEAFVVAAVELEFANVEEGAEAAPTPEK